MNKLFDVIFKDLKKDKSIYISLIAVVVISLVFGALFITILKGTDKELLTTHITSFFESIKTKEFIPSITNIILNNNIFGIIIWILGFSIIGIPIVICMLFYKGFALSFTVASLIYNFKLDGILLSFMYIFPHLILNFIFYFIVSYYSFKLSIKLLNKLLNKNELNMNKFIKKYLFVLLISVIIFTLSAVYETYIIPYLIKLIY